MTNSLVSSEQLSGIAAQPTLRKRKIAQKTLKAMSASPISSEHLSPIAAQPALNNMRSLNAKPSRLPMSESMILLSSSTPTEQATNPAAGVVSHEQLVNSLNGPFTNILRYEGQEHAMTINASDAINAQPKRTKEATGQLDLHFSTQSSSLEESKDPTSQSTSQSSSSYTSDADGPPSVVEVTFPHTHTNMDAITPLRMSIAGKRKNSAAIQSHSRSSSRESRRSNTEKVDTIEADAVESNGSRLRSKCVVGSTPAKPIEIDLDSSSSAESIPNETAVNDNPFERSMKSERLPSHRVPVGTMVYARWPNNSVSQVFFLQVYHTSCLLNVVLLSMVNRNGIGGPYMRPTK
jgi:hypothetical protein